MTIAANVTLDSGLVVTHHIVKAIVIQMHLGSEMVIASVQSWVDKARADAGEEPHFSSHPVAIPLASGIFAKAEAVLVTDTFCPLYGGTVTQDIVLTDLKQAKVNKRLEISTAKAVEMYAPKTTSLGTFDNTDSDNNKLSIVIQVTQLAEAKGLPAVAGFKDTNGVWAAYTLEQLGQIALEMTAQVLPLYEKEAAKFAEIDAAVDVAAVEAVVW